MAVCRNCEQPAEFKTLEGAPAYIEVCQKCQGWSVTGPIPKFAPCDIYSKSYFEGAEYLDYGKGEKVHRKNFFRKIELLKKNISLPISEWRLLEIGSATGAFLEVCRELGVKSALGVDVSEFARKQAQDKGFNVISPKELTSAVIQEFKPNVLVAWDVWEHLENPTELFADWIGKNSSIQAVAVSTVNASSAVAKRKGTSWRQFHPPSHLNYPTRKSFEIFLSENNFSIRSHTAFGYYRPLAEYLVAIVPMIKKTILASKWAFSIPLYLNLYDSQLVISTRN